MKLGLRSALEELLRERQFEAPVERAILAMTANRAMDLLIDSNEHIQEKVFISTVNLLNLEPVYLQLRALSAYAMSNEIDRHLTTSIEQVCHYT